MRAVFAKYPGIQVIGTFPTEDDYERALSVSESILQANPDLAAFASTVTTNVPAAARATESAGLGGGKVSIWGVAMGEQNAEYVKRGTVKGGLILDSGKMTYLAMQIAHDYVTKGVLPKGGESYGWAGEPVTIVAEKASYAPDVLLTVDNIDEFNF